MELELYDLDTDIQEMKNVAGQFPDIVRHVEEVMENEHRPSEIQKFKFPSLGD